jgi:serine/threonine protein kinase
MAGSHCGAYRLRQKLGKGNFGEVYKATKDSKRFALKFVGDTDEGASNEVRILRKVKHEGIVKYFEATSMTRRTLYG